MPLHVTDSGGEGQPVILLHGGGRNLGDWDAVRPLPSPLGYRVVAVDLRGHGATPAAPWTWELALQDVDAVVAGLELHRPVLVGPSLGGMIARSGRPVTRHVRSPSNSTATATRPAPTSSWDSTLCPLLVTRGTLSMTELLPEAAQPGWLAYEAWVRQDLLDAATTTVGLDVEWTDTGHDVHLEAPELVVSLVDERLEH